MMKNIIIIMEKHCCKEGWYKNNNNNNNNNKLLWDFPIQTDHKIERNRPDIVVIDKKERSCTIIINIACPFNHGVSHKKKTRTNWKVPRLKKIAEVPVEL